MLLAYSDDGPGPVVVLLHGFPLSREMWLAQRTTIGARYRVIAPDLRGHGESPDVQGISTMDGMADDVIDTLNALQLTQPVVIGGLSMGGYVALSLVERYPERVRGLILMNSRAQADPPQTAQVREDLAQLVESQGSPEPVVSSMMPKLFSPLTAQRRPEILGQLQAIMMANRPTGIAAALRGMAVRPDRTASLGRISVPTLIVAGADDGLIPMAESESLARAIPGARLVVIPDAGHLAPVENPADTNRALEEFLDTLA